IFDPYFTTKTGGSGLGLATTYSIVKKHDGDIQVDSIIGEGTTVTLFLPAAPAERNQPRKNEEVQHMEDSLGKILFMDDEELVRDVGQEMLQLIGYSVETAKNGEQAIEKYKSALKSQEPFKAVIMDLTVPGGMGGREAVQVIKAVDPGLRAIVSSGYSNDPIMADYKKYGFSGVVAKPYRIEEMKKVLDEVLGKGK
ncbi:MAG: response regulator, partial [Candidatus Aminicenantes bacterium]|nr:response regulator [Candidatus Aminicenantes bacterium]